jgi:DNA-binding transcriptional ArsR family regulator
VSERDTEREIDDPRSIKALAHPLRLRILDKLRESGMAATATSLSQSLGESTGATSYHLRELARHGFIEEAPELGDGRDRWWRAKPRVVRVSAGTDESPEYRAASARLRAWILERDANVLADYLDHEDLYSHEWQEAALFANRTLHVTVEELDELGDRILELLQPYERHEDADRPPDAHRVHLTLRALPWRIEQRTE